MANRLVQTVVNEISSASTNSPLGKQQDVNALISLPENAANQDLPPFPIVLAHSPQPTLLQDSLVPHLLSRTNPEGSPAAVQVLCSSHTHIVAVVLAPS